MSDNSTRVVVVTGASGGLGREAAVQFAAQGCRVVVAARRPRSLEETARLCREAGGEALAHLTDVTSEEQVQSLASATLDEWGRIDVWVNNAGVTLFALLEERSFEEHRRVIETNLYGPMFAARAVLPVFRRQKHGVLINVGSILSKVGQPAAPSLVISKFALRGLSETLRTEFADEPDIHVCTLFPYAIDTPHFQAAANQLGLKTFAMPPVQPVEKVARALVELAANPRRECHVPGLTIVGLAARWLMPETCERLIAHAVWRWHLGPIRQEGTEGNLYHGGREPGAVHGRRSPRLSAPALAAWAAADVVRMQMDAAWDFVSRTWSRLQSSA